MGENQFKAILAEHAKSIAVLEKKLIAVQELVAALAQQLDTPKKGKRGKQEQE